ncbi:MAG: hypothetical protein HY692_05085, partial [Cyanobacteria bacterium NC_groundwater_1444_Ag_S-0.65um_54_12]|nr:hypothetical protein [Cyanobacteria bacterium NC_groundwater_1444_Ag_S-0.65um_54_12]
MCTTCGCSGSTAEETVPEQTERATGPEHEMNRLIRIEQDILHENALEASQNLELLTG